MDTDEDYYRYVSLYYPDGEFATSGGMFIDAGCPHSLCSEHICTSSSPSSRMN